MSKSSAISTKQFPKFNYELNNYAHSKFGCIFVENAIIYRIPSFREFYQALGYTDEMKKNGILPEEFIWDEYHKDGAKKTDDCLQTKIMDYLCKHKIGFKEYLHKTY